MALIVKDRVKQQTTTTGTGTYTLSGSFDSFQTFAEIGDGNTTYYCCTDGTDFEIGIGTFTASGTTLARTTILQSSNSDAAVNWTSGTRTIFCTQPADKAVFFDADGAISIPDGSSTDNYLGIGNSDDFKIYHDGSQTVISNVSGSGPIKLQGKFGEQSIIANQDGAVELYHNNVQTLVTTNEGINIFNSDNDSTDGPVLNLRRISTSPAVDDILGDVRFIGRNSASQNVIYAGIDGIIYDETDGTENGALRFSVLNDGSNTTYTTLGNGISRHFQDHRWDDNVKAKFGTGDDLQIYHDGNKSVIQDAGTGQLLVRTSKLDVKNPDSSAVMLQATAAGAVELYHNNSKKLETTATGATVTGTLTSGGVFSNGSISNSQSAKGVYIGLSSGGDAQVSLVGDNTDVQPQIDFSHDVNVDYDVRLILEDNGNRLAIKSHNGSSAENMARFVSDGAVELFHDGSKKLETSSGGISVTGTVTDDGATHDGDVTFNGNSYNVVWDKSDNALELADNAKLKFGAGDDMEIFSDGNYGRIDANDLIIRGDDTDNRPQIYFQSYNTSNVVDYDTSTSLYFQGPNDAGEQVTYNTIHSITLDVSDGTEDGRIQFSQLQAGTSESTFIFDPYYFLLMSEQQLAWYQYNGSYSTYVNPITPTANRFIKLPDRDGLVRVVDQQVMTANLAVGWHTIAVFQGRDDSGDANQRFHAKFSLIDITSSRHQAFTFYAQHMFGVDDGLQVIGNSTFGTDVVTAIRVKSSTDGNRTYAGAAIQVYVADATNNLVLYLDEANLDDGENGMSYGHVILKTGVADATDPGDVGYVSASYSTFSEKVRIETNSIEPGGIGVTGNLLTQSNIVLEGATADAHETIITATDATADRTITLPDATGTVALENGNAVLLNTTTVSSGVSSVDFGSSLITDDFDNYLLVVEDLTVSAATDIRLRLGTANSADTSSIYTANSQWRGRSLASTTNNTQNFSGTLLNGNNAIIMGGNGADVSTASTASADFTIRFNNLRSTTFHKTFSGVTGSCVMTDISGANLNVDYVCSLRDLIGTYQTTSAVNFISIYETDVSSQISGGTFSLYGLKT